MTLNVNLMKAFKLFCTVFFIFLYLSNHSYADPLKYVGKVIIQINDNKGVCTGSLVKSNYVLTSAHCVHNLDKKLANPSQLRFNLPSVHKNFKIKQIHLTSGFRQERKYRNKYDVERHIASDWVLLELYKKLPPHFGYFKVISIKDIPLLRQEDSYAVKANFIGFGFKGDNLTRLNNFEAGNSNSTYDFLLLDINAGDGDSGGPVWINYKDDEYLIGVYKGSINFNGDHFHVASSSNNFVHKIMKLMN